MTRDEMCAHFTAEETAGKEEDQLLMERLAMDGDLRRLALDDLHIDGMLRGLLGAEGTGEIFARRFLAQLDAAGDGNEFVRALEGRLDEAAREMLLRKRRRRLWQLAACGATAALAVTLLVRFRPGSADVVAHGDFQVFHAGARVTDRGVRRGDRVIAGAGGATVDLGDHCHLWLDRASEVDLAGRPGRDAVVLGRGRVSARVVPRRGHFEVRTPLGTVEVVGTEFEISVVPVTAGEPSEAKVTVAVKSGKVACQVGRGARLLGPGESETFRGPPVMITEGTVAAVTTTAIEIQAASERFTIELVRAADIAHTWTSLPAVGDQVEVFWTKQNREIVATDLRGELVGRITQVDRTWLDLAPAAGGPPRRFGVRWVGPGPEHGGGLDLPMMELIGTLKPGTTVRVSWSLAEGTRLLDVTPVRP